MDTKLPSNDSFVSFRSPHRTAGPYIRWNSGRAADITSMAGVDPEPTRFTPNIGGDAA
jgi:hypothetical protein